MEQKNEQNQESPQQTQGNRGYQPIDESKINWQKLEEKWGVKRDDLEKSGDLNRMLNYGKSDLVRVSPNFGGEAFELDARLSFKKDGEGNVSPCRTSSARSRSSTTTRNTSSPTMTGRTCVETGNLGRVVDLVDRETGEIIPSFVSIDRKTNEITDVSASKVRIPERIGKTEITKQEQDMLRAGLPVRDKLIERKDGRKFVTTLQVNVEQRGVEFVPGTGRSPVPSRHRKIRRNRRKVRKTQPTRTRNNAATRGRTPTAASAPSANGRRGLHRAAESRLRGGQSRETGERDRQTGLPRHDVHQVQPGEGTPVPLRHQPRQRAEGRPFQREPHAGGGEQRGQDQRGYQEPEGAVAEGTDRPEGHRAATAAGEAAKRNNKGMKM